MNFEVKELLVELRSDIRALDTKLELKADRDRVHDLSTDLVAIKLTMATRKDLQELDAKLDGFDRFRSRVGGGFAVVTVAFSLYAGLVIYIIEHL